MKCFVDSDVVIDFLAVRHPHFESSMEFFHAIEIGQAKAGVASLSFSNVFYVLRQQERGAQDAMATLDKFRILVDILAVDGRHIQKALHSGFPDFEDSIQHQCAVANKMDCIVTRNLKHYKMSELLVYIPEKALEAIRRSR